MQHPVEHWARLPVTGLRRWHDRAQLPFNGSVDKSTNRFIVWKTKQVPDRDWTVRALPVCVLGTPYGVLVGAFSGYAEGTTFFGQ